MAHDLGIEASTCHHGKPAAIGSPQADPFPAAERDCIGNSLDRWDKTDFNRQHIGCAQGNDGDRWSRLIDPVQDLVDGTIAAGDREHVGAFDINLAGQFLRTAPRRRGFNPDLAAAIVKGAQNCVQAALVATTGRRVGDDQNTV